MTRDEQNRSEWSRPENWRGGWLGVYVAPRDSRIWVPKRAPWIGWTLNFAHRRSWVWLIGLIGLPAVIAMLISGSAR
jgi:uncharacterized membrane protein